MNNVKVNNEISMTYPDGFNEMGDEELTRYFGSPANRWGVYHPGEHNILSVGWKKAGFLADPEMELFRMQSSMRRSLLNYQQITTFKTKIASKKDNAYGVRFEYRVNDARMVHVCDLIVFKVKNTFYAIHFITRKPNAAASRPAFKETLDSIKIG